MARKTFVSVKRGLTQDPKHRERMGNRIWLFLHIVDRADFETGMVYDWRDKDEGEDMGLNWRTLQRQRQELDSLGYIKCEITGRGLNIVVYNWHNPRSYSGEAINPRPFAQPENGEYAEVSNQSTQESTQSLITDLRTPSIQLTNQKSHAKYQPPAAPAPTPEKPEGEKPKAKREPKPKTPEQQAKEQEIDDVLSVFVEVTGIPKPSKKNATYGIRWINVARDFIARHNGRSADAMRLAAEKHKRGRDGAGQPLSTKDPGSVKYACPTKEELDAYLAKRNATPTPRRAPAPIVFEK